MEKYSIGEIIRYLRKEQHLTQEELADGICSNVTISRIENGTQMPSDRIINQLLARLGSDLYYTANIAREKRNQEIEQALSRVAEPLNMGDAPKAAALLDRIDEADITDAQNRQLYILLKAAIGLSTGTPCTDEIIKELRQGLALTKKNFSFTSFSDVPLTVREANLLNVLCAAYFYHGETGQATALAKELSSHLIRHQASFQNDLELLLNAMINLSQLLKLEKDYGGALETCEQAIAISKESRHQPFFAELHFFKAELLLRLGQSEECQKLLSVIHPFMQLQGKTSFTALMDDLYREMRQDPP